MKKSINCLIIISLFLLSGCSSPTSSSSNISSEADMNVRTSELTIENNEKQEIEEYILDNYGYYPNLDIQYRCWTDSPPYYNTEYVLTTQSGEKLEGEFGLNGSPCIFYAPLSDSTDKFISLHLNPGEKNMNLMAYIKLCDISNSVYEDQLIYSKSISQLSKGKFICFLDDDKFGILEQSEKNPGQINSLYSLTKDPDALPTPTMNPSYSEELILKKLEDINNNSQENCWSYKKELNHNAEYKTDTSQYEVFNDNKHYYFGAGFTNIARNDWNETQELYTESETCELINSQLSSLLSNATIFLNPNAWDSKWENLDIDLQDTAVFTLNIEFPPCSIESENSINSTLAYSFNTESTLQQGISGDDKIAGSYVTPEELERIQEEASKPKKSASEIALEEIQPLNGFWYSDNYEYLYCLYLPSHDGPTLSSLKFANYYGPRTGDTHSGQFKYKAKNSYILKTNEDRIVNLPVVYDGTDLISEEVTLKQVSPFKAESIIGLWTDNEVTVEFTEEGNFKISGNKQRYDFGDYFLTDSSLIIMDLHSETGLNPYNLYLTGNRLQIKRIRQDGSETDYLDLHR